MYQILKEKCTEFNYICQDNISIHPHFYFLISSSSKNYEIGLKFMLIYESQITQFHDNGIREINNYKILQKDSTTMWVLGYKSTPVKNPNFFYELFLFSKLNFTKKVYDHLKKHFKILYHYHYINNVYT